jgi:hypothetical protein
MFRRVVWQKGCQTFIDKLQACVRLPSLELLLELLKLSPHLSDFSVQRLYLPL